MRSLSWVPSRFLRRGRNRALKPQSAVQRRCNSRNWPHRVECLEQRQMLTTLLVTNGDDAGAGSLRSAVTAANAMPGRDRIEFQNGVDINLTTGQLEISDDVLISGPGADKLTIDANGNSRVFTIDTDVSAEIYGMTITGGEVTGNDGGGIFNSGSLALNGVVISGNIASNGGAVFHAGSELTVVNSEISDNAALSSGGGLFLAGLSPTIINTTISGNSANDFGGGVRGFYVFPTFVFPTFISSTIANNRADADSDGLGVGGGYASSNAAAVLISNVFAGNFRGTGNSADDITADSIIAVGLEGSFNNLISDPSSAGGMTHNVQGNILGDGAGSQLPIDTIIGPLLHNGGPTRTHLPPAGSPLVDSGFASFGRQVVTDSPLAWWRFDEPRGRINAIDSAGNLHGTVSVDGTDLDEGGITGDVGGRSVEFDGIDGLIEIAAPGALPASLPDGSLTVEAWVNATRFVDQAGVISAAVDDDGTQKGWYLSTNDEQELVFRIATTGATDFSEVRAPVGVDEWNHVVAQYDGDFVSLYVNGLLIDEVAATGTIDYPTSGDGGFVFGAFRDADDEIHFQGGLDDVAIYDGLLDFVSIQKHYAAGALDDQRGGLFARNDGNGVDIGATERQIFRNLELVVTTADDELDEDPLTTLNDLSLREAVSIANSVPGLKEITFDPALAGTTFVLSSELSLSEPVVLNGLGAQKTIISGNFQNRAFSIGNSADVSISGVTIQDGAASTGGAILVSSGSLTLTDSALRDNTGQFGGGAIHNQGNTTIVASEISDNTAFTVFSGLPVSGGGVLNEGTNATLRIINSTVSDNFGSKAGAGVANLDGQVEITNSTVFGNRAEGLDAGGGVFASGIFSNNANVLLQNSIVAGNTNGRNFIDGDMGTAAIVAVGSRNNIVGDAASAGGLVNATGGNQVGVDPKLGPLQINAGALQTHALLDGSPAIDTGNSLLARTSSIDPLKHDQRGFPFSRVFGSAVDIGAFEVGSLSSVLSVSTNTDISDGDYSNGELSLREAIELANLDPDPQLIDFNLAFGTNISLTGSRLSVATDMTIVGLRAGTIVDAIAQADPEAARSGITIDGEGASGRTSGIIQIESGVTATITGIAFRDGVTPSSSGGALVNLGTLTVENAIFVGNRAMNGGAIFNVGTLVLDDVEIGFNRIANTNRVGVGNAIENTGTLTIQNHSLLFKNGSISSPDTAALRGGAIFNTGILTVLDSTIENNFALLEGGAIWNGSEDLQAVTVKRSRLRLNQVFWRNFFDPDDVRTARGGAYYSSGGDTLFEFSEVELNFAVSDNGGGQGGGIYVASASPGSEAVVEVFDTTVARNAAEGSDVFDSPGQGGGLYAGAGGILAIGNSTISLNGRLQASLDNTAMSARTETGGGIYIEQGVTQQSGILELERSTVTLNMAGDLTGGGIRARGEVFLLNGNIIAGNGRAAARDDLDLTDGFTVFSPEFNVIGVSSNHDITDGVDGNQVGSPVAFLDPKLGPLEFNGGFGKTHAPLSGSPAVDNGFNGTFLDQRGEPTTGQRDAGSVEANFTLTRIESEWSAAKGSISQFTGGDAIVYGFGFDDGQPDEDGDGKSDLSGVEKEPKFFGVEFDPDPLVIGGVTKIFGLPFGAEVIVDVEGRFGVEVGLYFNSGSLDLSYDGLLEYSIEKPVSGAGPTRIATSLDVTEGELFTISPRLGGYVDIVFELDAEISAFGYAGKKFGGTLPALRIDENVPLISINRPRPNPEGGADILDGRFLAVGQSLFNAALEKGKNALDDLTGAGEALRKAQIDLRKALGNVDDAETPEKMADRQIPAKEAFQKVKAASAAQKAKASQIKGGKLGGAKALIGADVRTTGDQLGLSIGLSVGVGGDAGGVGLSLSQTIGSVQATIPEISLDATSITTGVNDPDFGLADGLLTASTDEFADDSLEEKKRRFASLEVDVSALSGLGGTKRLALGPLGVAVTPFSYKLQDIFNFNQDVAAIPTVNSAGFKFDQLVTEVLVNGGPVLADANGFFPFTPGDVIDVTPANPALDLTVTPKLDIDAKFRNDIGVDNVLQGVFEALKLQLNLLGNNILTVGPLIGPITHRIVDADIGSIFNETFTIPDLQTDPQNENVQLTSLQPFVIDSNLPVGSSALNAFQINGDRILPDSDNLTFINVPLRSNGEAGDMFFEQIDLKFGGPQVSTLAVQQSGITIDALNPDGSVDQSIDLIAGESIFLGGLTDFRLSGFSANQQVNGGAIIALGLSSDAFVSATPVSPVDVTDGEFIEERIAGALDEEAITQANLVFVDSDLLLDIDGNGEIGTFTDGVLAARFAAGMRGSSLIVGAVAPDATRTTASQIANYIEVNLVNGFRQRLDADGNGQFDGATDGQLIARALAGFTGTALTDQVVGDSATRTGAGEIGEFVDGAIDHDFRTSGFNDTGDLTMSRPGEDPFDLIEDKEATPDAVPGSSIARPLEGTGDAVLSFDLSGAGKSLTYTDLFLRDTAISVNRDLWDFISTKAPGSPRAGKLIEEAIGLEGAALDAVTDRLLLESRPAQLGVDEPIFVRLPDAEGYTLQASPGLTIQGLDIFSDGGPETISHPVVDVFIPSLNQWLVLRADEPLAVPVGVSTLQLFVRPFDSAILDRATGRPLIDDRLTIGMRVSGTSVTATVTATVIGNRPRGNPVEILSQAIDTTATLQRNDLNVELVTDSGTLSSTQASTTVLNIRGRDDVTDTLIIEADNGPIAVPVNFNSGTGGGNSIQLNGGGFTLDLINEVLTTGVENIDLRGSGANSLIVNRDAVDRNLTQSRTLQIRRNADDTVLFGLDNDEVWTDGGTETIDGVLYRRHHRLGATIFIEEPPAAKPASPSRQPVQNEVLPEDLDSALIQLFDPAAPFLVF